MEDVLSGVRLMGLPDWVDGVGGIYSGLDYVDPLWYCRCLSGLPVILPRKLSSEKLSCLADLVRKWGCPVHGDCGWKGSGSTG